LGNFSKYRIGREKNEVLLDLIGGSVLPQKVQEAIFSIRKQDSTFGLITVDDVCIFPSESSASFESK